MALLFFGLGFTKGHSFVSVDDFSKHHDQKFLNQLEFDFFSIAQTSHSWCFILSVRGACMESERRQEEENFLALS